MYLSDLLSALNKNERPELIRSAYARSRQKNPIRKLLPDVGFEIWDREITG